MFERFLIDSAGARNIYQDGRPVGYGFQIHNCYYRGVPLPLIDVLEVAIDGEKVKPEDIYLICDGKEYPYQECGLSASKLENTYWHFNDTLFVKIKKEGGITQGMHKVELGLRIRISYIPTRGTSVVQKEIMFA